MTKMHVFVLGAALSLLAGSAMAQGAPKGDAKAGLADFNKYGCYTCHGFEGQGVPGRKIAPNPLPFAAFSAFVRTSPDHGTAFDLAGSGRADASSFAQAVEMARVLLA